MFEDNLKYNKISEAIIRTVAFFDMFDFPMTAFEIWKYLGVKCSLSDVAANLENTPLPAQAGLAPLVRGEHTPPCLRRQASPPLLGGIEHRDGFYFLQGRSGIVDFRMERYNITDKKFKRAIWVAKIFRFIPWIKMIAVANIYGANNSKETSDIDLIIITENNRVWITRFFCVGIAKILNLRPRPDYKKDKICLSFFAGEDAMNLEKLMLASLPSASPTTNGAHANKHFGNLHFTIDKNNIFNSQDIVFIYWIAGFMPIYQKGKIYHRFMEANEWLYKVLPNWFIFESANKRFVKSRFSNFYRDIIDLFIGGLEKNLMKWQLNIMPEKLKSMMNQDTRVVINEKILKLHSNDKREEYLNIYTKKLDEIFGKNN